MCDNTVEEQIGTIKTVWNLRAGPSTVNQDGFKEISKQIDKSDVGGSGLNQWIRLTIPVPNSKLKIIAKFYYRPNTAHYIAVGAKLRVSLVNGGKDPFEELKEFVV